MSPIWSWEGVRSLRVDIEKIRLLPSLAPPISLDEGLRRAAGTLSMRSSRAVAQKLHAIYL